MQVVVINVHPQPTPRPSISWAALIPSILVRVVKLLDPVTRFAGFL